MSGKKPDRTPVEIERDPVEVLETEELDEAHGGFRPIGTTFNTVTGRGDAFNTVYGGIDKFITYDPFDGPNDLPLKR